MSCSHHRVPLFPWAQDSQTLFLSVLPRGPQPTSVSVPAVSGPVLELGCSASLRLGS